MTNNPALNIKDVLIIDDEAVIRKGISRVLSDKGIRSVSASNGLEALDLLKEQSFDLALLDIKMPEMDGLSVLKIIKELYPGLSVIMITGYPTIDTAVDCIKLGAIDYLIKPFRIKDLEASLDKLTSGAKTVPNSRISDQPVNGLYINTFQDFIIGKSSVMQSLFNKVLKVAPTDSTVIISGESGTGKELIAKAIHAYSDRKDKEFVAVDCSALVETLLESELFGHVKGSFTGAFQTKHGLLELANSGTFFFDEISNLSPKIQAKLLRVIQEREFMKVGDQKKIKLDIRIISASNKDLQEAITQGTFREDLYYRLSVVPLRIPPLRNRREDIPLLIGHFLKKYSKKVKRNVPEISPEAMDILLEHSWPGNVRELEHTIERILILAEGDIIRTSDLPSFISRKQGEFQMFSEDVLSLMELEKKYIRFVLRKTKGRKTDAAKILGINRKTLGLKIKKYGLY